MMFDLDVCQQLQQWTNIYHSCEVRLENFRQNKGIKLTIAMYDNSTNLTIQLSMFI